MANGKPNSKPKVKEKARLEEPEPGKEQEYKLKWWRKLKEVLEEEGSSLA